MTTISKSCFKQNYCLTKLLIACSLTWWIQGLSSTCPVFKYFQGLEFRRKKFKYFQVLSRMRGNPACMIFYIGEKRHGSNFTFTYALLHSSCFTQCTSPNNDTFTSDLCLFPGDAYQLCSTTVQVRTLGLVALQCHPPESRAAYNSIK